MGLTDDAAAAWDKSLGKVQGETPIEVAQIRDTRELLDHIQESEGVGNVFPERDDGAVNPGLLNFWGDIAAGPADEKLSQSAAGDVAEAAFEMPKWAKDDIDLPGRSVVDTGGDPVEGTESVVQEAVENTTGVDLGKGLGDELGLIGIGLGAVAGAYLLGNVFTFHVGDG